MSIIPASEPPEGARAAGGGYWFTPLPVYLVDAAFDPSSPVNAPAAMLWAHIHRHYAWRRRVFPSYATLAEETSQSESAVKRQLSALKAAGALTWGATYGSKGRSSNEYALAPMKPFDFDRQVEVKNDPHPPVKVKNDLGVEVKIEPYPQVKNDLGVESTEEVRASLSSRRPRQPTDDPKDEREISAAPDNDQAQQVAEAWTAARGGRRNPSAENAIRQSAAELLMADWPLTDLIALAQDMAAKYPTGRNLSRHADHWQPPKTTAPSGTATAPLPAPCQTCEAAHPASRFNARLRTTPAGSPCPACHPDAAPIAA